MYNRLKRILASTTMVFIAIVGILFVKANQSEMFGGHTEVVVIDRAVADIEEQLTQIAYETNSVFARRIVESNEQESGELRNTYVPIGSDILPETLPKQTDPRLIEKSPYHTVYVVAKGNITADKLAELLNTKHNKARPLHTNYSTVLLLAMFRLPQSLMIVCVLLVAFSSLVLAEYISGMKEIGIRRISGEGKHHIAMAQIYQDSLFLCGNIVFSTIGVIGVLYYLRIFSMQALWIIITPLIIWFIILLVVNFVFCNVFYYILQNQPIILSVKGKAPIKIIFGVVISVQCMALCSMMYSVYGVSQIDNELALLYKGKQAWEKHPDLYQMTSLDSGGIISEEQLQNFYKELKESVTVIYRESDLSGIKQSNSLLKNSYEPTAELISNVIYVNRAFIFASGIQLETSTQQVLDNMKNFDKLILIPDSQKQQFDVLKEKWIKFEKRGFLPDDAPFNDPHPNAKISTALYTSRDDVFIYPVFTFYRNDTVDVIFAKKPIIVVVDLPIMSANTVLVSDNKKVNRLIKEHGVTAEIGALTNGLYAVNAQIQRVHGEKTLLIVATVISLLSSIVLLLLLNTIYFYQGRRIYFIERLAGKSHLLIHKNYLITVAIAHVMITGGAFVLGLPNSVKIVPMIYMIIIFTMFTLHLKREKRANILYLKGE